MASRKIFYVGCVRTASLRPVPEAQKPRPAPEPKAQAVRLLRALARRTGAARMLDFQFAAGVGCTTAASYWNSLWEQRYVRYLDGGRVEITEKGRAAARR